MRQGIVKAGAGRSGFADHLGDAGWIAASAPDRRADACEALIDLAAVLFNVPGRALRSPRRCAQPIARVRQIAMYLCNTSLGVSLTEIGRVFCRDRTTVSHAVQLVETLRDDREFDLIIDRCERVVLAAFAERGGRHE